jgi:hypothetical protein
VQLVLLLLPLLQQLHCQTVLPLLLLLLLQVAPCHQLQQLLWLRLLLLSQVCWQQPQQQQQFDFCFHHWIGVPA